MPSSVESARRLVLFTRLPTIGHTKTRLIPALGAAGAAALHGRLVETLLSALRAHRQRWRAPTEIELRYTGGSPEELHRWLGPCDDLRLAPQGEGDLGERMHRAFCQANAEGVGSTLLFGSDVPDLTTTILEEAFASLASGADVVFGPAEDGGYFLVGLREPQAVLFSAMTWSTAEVLQVSLGRARAAGLQLATVDTLADVDEPADLARLRYDPRFDDLL